MMYFTVYSKQFPPFFSPVVLILTLHQLDLESHAQIPLITLDPLVDLAEVAEIFLFKISLAPDQWLGPRGESRSVLHAKDPEIRLVCPKQQSTRILPAPLRTYLIIRSGT